MKNPAMAIAYSIKRKNSGKYPTHKDPNYAHGGEVNHISLDEQSGGDSDGATDDPGFSFSPESIVQSLRKKMGKGSYPVPEVIEGYSAGGEVDDDFLSDEENTALPDETTSPDDRKKRLLARAFEMVRARHTK